MEAGTCIGVGACASITILAPPITGARTRRAEEEHESPATIPDAIDEADPVQDTDDGDDDDVVDDIIPDLGDDLGGDDDGATAVLPLTDEEEDVADVLPDPVEPDSAEEADEPVPEPPEKPKKVTPSTWNFITPPTFCIHDVGWNTHPFLLHRPRRRRRSAWATGARRRHPRHAR